MRKKLDCKAAVYALTFGMLGGAFLITGLVLLSVGAGGTLGLVFFEFGVLCLMVFGASLMWADLLHRRWDSLRRTGKAAEGRVEQVTHHLSITLRAQAGNPRGSPWSAVCRYRWEGEEYTVRSGLLWCRPRAGGAVTVYLDPARPERAYADPSTIPVE